MTFAVWFLLRFTALLPVAIAVLRCSSPTGASCRGAGASRAGQPGVMLLACAGLHRGPVIGRAARRRSRPASTPTRPRAALAPIARRCRPSSLAAQLIGLVRRAGRRRRAPLPAPAGPRPRPDALAALGRRSSIAPRHRGRRARRPRPRSSVRDVLPLIVLPPVAMTVAVVDPRLVSDRRPARPHRASTARSSRRPRRRRPRRGGRAHRRCSATPRPAPGRALVLLLPSLLYGPLRQRLWLAGCAGWCSATATTPTTSVAGLASTLETTDEGAEQLAAVARAVASAFGVGVRQRRGRPRRRRAAGRDPRRPRPAETRTLPITYRDAEVGRLVLPARGLRSRLSAPRRGAARRPGPAGRHRGPHQPAGRRAAGEPRAAGRWPARRSAAGSAATCTTGWARRSAAWCSGSSRRGCWSTATRTPRRPSMAATSRARAGRRRRRTPAGARPAPARARRPRPGRRAAPAGRAARARRAAVDVDADDLGPLPAAVEVAAFRIAGEALTNVARHAGARPLHRPARRGRRRRCSSRSPTTGSASPPTRQAGVGLVGRCASGPPSSAAAAEVTCPPAAAPSCGPGCP